MAGFNCSLFDFIHAATASTHSEICDENNARETTMHRSRGLGYRRRRDVVTGQMFQSIERGLLTCIRQTRLAPAQISESVAKNSLTEVRLAIF